MKKLLTFVFLAMLVYTANAQSSNFKAANDSSAVVNSKFVYCELIGYEKVFSTSVNIQIDFGQSTKLLADKRLRDEQTGKVKSFNSMIDAMNYMGEDGWELVQIYDKMQNETVMYHWVLKKKVEVGAI